MRRNKLLYWMANISSRNIFIKNNVLNFGVKGTFYRKNYLYELRVDFIGKKKKLTILVNKLNLDCFEVWIKMTRDV